MRRAGQRVRITAQLIEAANGAHLWAERYDRSLDDIFAVQDEVAQRIVSVLFGQMEEARFQQSLRKPTVSLAAYDLLLQGIRHLRGYAPGDNEQALRLFERAIGLDPGYGLAHAYRGLATVLLQRETNADGMSVEAQNSALEGGLVGVRLDPQESRCHGALAIVRLFRREYDLAEHHTRQAITLNPNDADLMAQIGFVLAIRGRPEEALAWIEKAKRLNPFHPPQYDAALGGMLRMLRRYPEALQVLGRLPRLMSGPLAACHAQLEQMEAARAHIAELLREEPGLTATSYVNRGLIYERAEDREQFRDELIKAGLPA